jgi:GH35 family endo-1,4-beta-xylanase
MHSRTAALRTVQGRSPIFAQKRAATKSDKANAKKKKATHAFAQTYSILIWGCNLESYFCAGEILAKGKTTTRKMVVFLRYQVKPMRINSGQVVT